VDKNSKSVTSLFIVLALLALIALAVSVSQNDNQDNRSVLVPGLAEQLNNVDAVRIIAPGNSLVADIRRTDTIWLVDNADNYPADIGTLRSHLLTLSEAVIVENTTALEENYPKLGVANIKTEDASGIQVEIDGITDPVKLILGNASSGNTSFARLAGQAQSWRISVAPAPGRTTLDWLDRNLTDIASADIQAIEINHADGESVAIKKSETGFELLNKPADKALQYDGALNSITGVMKNLDFDVVISATELADKNAAPVATISATTTTGLIININAVSLDEEIWLTLNSGQDAELAIETGDEDSATESATDAKTQSDALTAKLSGWAYKVPAFKSDWLLKRNADLLEESE